MPLRASRCPAFVHLRHRLAIGALYTVPSGREVLARAAGGGKGCATSDLRRLRAICPHDQLHDRVAQHLLERRLDAALEIPARPWIRCLRRFDASGRTALPNAEAGEHAERRFELRDQTANHRLVSRSWCAAAVGVTAALFLANIL